MKDAKAGVATFIPLDSLKTKPVKSSLRKIPQCKLLMDVLTFDKDITVRRVLRLTTELLFRKPSSML